MLRKTRKKKKGIRGDDAACAALGIAKISPLLRRETPAPILGAKKGAPEGARYWCKAGIKYVTMLTQVLENGVIKFGIYAPHAKCRYRVLVKLKRTRFAAVVHTLGDLLEWHHWVCQMPQLEDLPLTV